MPLITVVLLQKMAQHEVSIAFLGNESDFKDLDSLTMIELLDAKNSIKHMSLEIPEKYQWVICGYCWMLFAIGSYFKKFFYSLYLDKYKQKRCKPIDVLMFPIVFIQHLAIAMSVTKATLAVMNGSGLEEIGLSWFCWLSRAIILFDLAYSTVGSFFISIFRVLYIKHGHQIMNAISERSIMYIFLIASILMSVISVTFLHIYSYDNITKNTCYARSTYELRQLYDEYQISKGNEGVHEQFIMVRAGLVLICICMVITEYCIYVSLFHMMYKKDNNERLRRLLDPSVIRNRNKTNAITLISQCCSFAVEITFMIIIVVCLRFQLVQIGFLLKVMAFAAMSVIEVLSSSSLRHKLVDK